MDRLRTGRLVLERVSDAFYGYAREAPRATRAEVLFEAQNAGISFEQRIVRARFALFYPDQQHPDNDPPMHAIIVSIPEDACETAPPDEVARRVRDRLRLTKPGEIVREAPYPLDPAYFRALGETPLPIREEPKPLGRERERTE